MMEDLSKQLLDLGVEVGKDQSSAQGYEKFVFSDSPVAFSGYGTFTPIKVTSGTNMVHADVERNKR